MKGELDNIRAWGTYLSTIKNDCDVIMIEYARNAPKKMDVDIFLLEYLVYIGTCTA